MKTFWKAALSLLLFLLLASLPAAGQQLALRGGKVHTLAGAVHDPGVVVVEDGKIVSVEAGDTIPANASILDVTGLEVYPGLFDAISRLGLTEIGSVSATVDASEIGDFTPHLQAATAVHPASEMFPVARANGITHTGAAPGPTSRRRSSVGFEGQASVIHTAGWTVEEMAVDDSAAMMLGWPGLRASTFDFATFSRKPRPFREAKEEYEEKVEALKEWLTAARRYREAGAPANSGAERDLRLEALARVVHGEQPLVVSVNDARGIRQVLEFFGEYRKEGLRLILAGVREGWKVRELLAAEDVPVILGATQTLPSEEDDPYDSPFTNAAQLHEAGVRIAFATFDASDSRTLPYEAGHAVAYGLPWEEAMAAVTKNAAEFFGLGDRLGTIEPGKIANLVVTDGDPLEIRTQVRHVLVNGRPVSLDNKHLRLYEQYRARP